MYFWLFIKLKYCSVWDILEDNILEENIISYVKL